MVKAFRRDIDPLFVPLWVRNVYRSSGGTDLVFDRHVLAVGLRWSEMPVQQDLQNVFLPTGYFNHYPNSILPFDGILEGPPLLDPKLPGGFIPIDWSHYQRYRGYAWAGRYLDMDKYGEEVALESLERTRAIDRAWKAESDYRLEHDWKHLTKLGQQLDVQERNAVLASRPQPRLF